MSTAMKGRVDADATRQLLEQLGLTHAAESLPRLLGDAVKEEIPVHRFLDLLLQTEQSQREERRIKTSLKLSGLPTGQTLGSFDWAFQPGIERSRIETLATCAWIRGHETVLVCGPPGVGKTHLAVALGVKAIENRFSVSFYRLQDLLHAMKQDAEAPPRRLRGKKYMSVSLLEPAGGEPLLQAGQLPVPARKHAHHDEQVGQGLARDPRRGRSDGDRTARPTPAPLPRPQHQGAFVPAAGS